MSLFIPRAAIFFAALLVSCASYQSTVSDSRDLLAAGDYEDAVKNFEKQVENESGDKLAYLLEYATALHLAGQYKESNAAFESADTMCDINDYNSISRETGAMLVKEGVVQYKAETFEFLLINIYQALNYLLLGDFENAQVKARRLNEKINKIELGKESKKQQTSFAAYLAGVLWEAQGDWDNAYILYKKAADLNASSELFKKSVLIAAYRTRRDDDFKKYKNQWEKVHNEINWKNLKSSGEFIFILQQGWIPRKQPQRGNRTLPELVSVPSQVRSASAEVSGVLINSEIVYDLDDISKTTLAEDMARLVARAVARQASRIAVREAARQKKDGSPVLAAAAIASVVFDVMDVADLRQWSTLPATFQMVRIPLAPGSYSIRVMPNGEQSQSIWSGEVKIEKGKKFIHSARVF